MRVLRTPSVEGTESMVGIEQVVGRIYDCAANPELWPDVLSEIRDLVGAAYCLVGFIDTTPTNSGQTPILKRRNSPWNEDALLQLDGMISAIPQGNRLFEGGIDTAWTQMSHTSEEEFQNSLFFKQWAGPHGLRDTVNIAYLQRNQISGAISAPRSLGQELYGAAEKRIFEMISPHVRRAMMINDLADKGRMAATLYRHVLDSLSVAVFVVGQGRRLVFTNAMGERLLEGGTLLSAVGGTLHARMAPGAATAFDDALDRAATGHAAMGLAGIGVPLIGENGDRAAAYVLPIGGNDVRGSLGTGHCAVFVAQRGEQQPVVIEMLRTLFDFTQTEARVANLISQGDGPMAIAHNLGLSIHTVRSHLKHAYAKSRTADQTSLSGLLNSLMPPVLLDVPVGGTPKNMQTLSSHE
jgi:DNA-binding CsgD family transcriptional regulator